MFNRIKAQLQSPYKDTIEQRQALMIIQGIASIAFAGLGIWLAWWEFGSVIFSQPIFWVLLGAWGYLNLSAFMVRIEATREKTVSEKLDDLLKEISGLRKDLSSRGLSNGSNDNPDTKL